MSVTSPACAVREPAQQPQKIEPQGAPSIAEKSVINVRLPPNQRFATLDEFLAHLRNVEAPTDGAWYREIQPGIYQLETGNRRRIINQPGGGEAKQVFTRQQLLEKFGFSK